MFPETGAGESCYRRCSADGKERNGRGDSRQPNRDRAPNDAQPPSTPRGREDRAAEIRGLIGGGSIRYLSRVDPIPLPLLSISTRVESFVTISPN